MNAQKFMTHAEHVSGFYLYLTAIQPGTSQLSSYATLMFTEALNEVRFNTITERTRTAINELQDRFCCCGLNGPADYGWEFEKEHDRRVARARYIRSWRAQMDSELEHERKDEFEEDTISDKAEQKSAISQASEQKQNAGNSQKLNLEPIASTDGPLQSKQESFDSARKMSVNKDARLPYQGLRNGEGGRTSAGRGASNRWRKTPRQKPVSLSTTVSARASNSSEKEESIANPSQVNEPLLGSQTISN
ncbi:unnamed protein product [Haemonchus placei]|uniref:Cyclin_C domain-containing protein n=1 Tax=Haemonchus placei TaxID=6290 RepID=A0A0N4X8V6_HAEPC|nr:unnamed protein product [Haemonchus placei]